MAIKGRRKAPTNSLLDRATLVSALEDADLYGTSVKPVHVQGFYQALHRQHYPPPAKFVENYHLFEQRSSSSIEEYGKPIKNSITQIKNANKVQLSRAFLDFLSNDCPLQTLTSSVVDIRRSQDKSTTKFVIELHDGQRVESVLMRYEKNNRASLCVSSQVCIRTARTYLQGLTLAR